MKRATMLVSAVLGLLFVSLSVQPASANIDCNYPPSPVSFVGRVSSGVNVRNKTCMEESTIIGRLAGGATVKVIGEADGWYQVKLSDGTVGFVWGDFISKTDTTEISNTTSTKTTVTNDVATRMKGHILLQVESHGEAWYVRPDDSKRYYMKDGQVAYEMMRQFGLGISNADLAKLKAGNLELKSRLKGKIVLQVESHGEAYYVHPTKGTLHYLKNGDEAYRIMRELSLGITNKDLTYIPVRSFDDYISEKESTTNVDDYSRNGTITMSAYLESGAVYLNWNVKGFEPKDGFKVVYSDSVNASYPGDSAEYVDSSKRAHTITNLNADTTYYFRVCAYLGGGACGTYSNEVVLKTATASGKIVLTGYIENGKVFLGWSVSDVSTTNGFKVVWSESANPIYPGNEYHYLGSSGARNDVLSDMSPGTYHFRVCQYLGGSCGKYSNDIELTVPSNNVASTTITNSPAQSGVVPSEVNLTALNEYWLAEVNALRAERGLRQLVLDQRWVDTATEWAVYMGETGVMSHDRPDGKTMHQWIDTKGLPFTVRYSADGWSTNYFTENIAWGYASSGTTEAVQAVLDDTMDFYLSEASYNGAHYRTIYHADWNSVGLGFYFTPSGNGYKVSVAMHYGSLVLN